MVPVRSLKSFKSPFPQAPNGKAARPAAFLCSAILVGSPSARATACPAHLLKLPCLVHSIMMSLPPTNSPLT